MAARSLPTNSLLDAFWNRTPPADIARVVVWVDRLTDRAMQREIHVAGLSDVPVLACFDEILERLYRGGDSHGVLWIPRYVEMVELGLINPAAAPGQLSGSGAAAISDAERAPGAVGIKWSRGRVPVVDTSQEQLNGFIADISSPISTVVKAGRH